MTSSIERDQANGWIVTEQPDIISSKAQRVFASDLPGIAGAVTLTGVAYWVYVGLAPRAITVANVRFHVSTGGSSTQAGEVALASSPAAPNCAAQVLTKISANATLSDLTGTGAMSNTVSMAQAVAAGTHLWAGYRVAMAGTQPTVYGLTADTNSGSILSTAAAGVLTGAGPWTGALIASLAAWMCPRLTITLD